MTNVVSALTARTQFGQIIKRATQRNERFVVGRRGEPSVVIMSMKDYMATAKRTGANKLGPGHINRIVTAVRKEQKPSSAKRRGQ